MSVTLLTGMKPVLVRESARVHPDKVLKQHHCRPPDGRICPMRPEGAANPRGEAQGGSPPATRSRPQKDRSSRRNQGQRPPGPRRTRAGGFGPPAGLGSTWRGGRGDGPCHGNDAVPPPLRAGTGNALRFPARAERCHQDRCCPHQERPAPAPGGREAPAGGGAGAGRGLWPPGGREGSVALWQGRWPLPWQRRSSAAASGGNRKRMRFPRPCGTVPRRPAGPGTPQASARPGGREAPAGGGAGAGRGFGPPAGQGSAGRCGRGDGPCQDAQGARRRKSFPRSGQAAPATGTFSAPFRRRCLTGMPWLEVLS